MEDKMTIEVVPLEETLEQLGLTKTEAKVYLCLLDQSPLPAATIADQTGTSRSSVYLVLRSLVAKGLIDAGAGYSSRYHAAPPSRALTGLLERNRADLAARERHIEQALPELTELFEQNQDADGELVEILRTPTLIGERFDRLQSESQETIDIVVRGPLQVGGSNEAELAALRRGVRARAIYDRNVLAEPSVDLNLSEWTTQGELARLYPGDLPHEVCGVRLKHRDDAAHRPWRERTDRNHRPESGVGRESYLPLRHALGAFQAPGAQPREFDDARAGVASLGRHASHKPACSRD